MSTGFTGHEHDPELGLINMQGRLYDPHIGRFITPDPFVQAPFWSQGLNRYSYVVNNPLNFTDPSGFFWGKLGGLFGGLLPGSGSGTGGSTVTPCDTKSEKQCGSGALPGNNTGNPIVDLTKNGIQSGGVTTTVPGGATGGGVAGGGMAGGGVPGGDGYISGGGPLGPRGMPPAAGGGFRPPNASMPGGGNFDNGGGFYNDWLTGQQSPDPRMMRSNHIGTPPAAAAAGAAAGAAGQPTGAAALTVACLANPLCAAQVLGAAIVTYVIITQTETMRSDLVKSLQQHMSGSDAPPLTPKDAQRTISHGRGPRGITRIDPPDPRYPGTQWEAHTGGRGSPALQQDGTWKHVPKGTKPPTIGSAARDFLREHGWKI